MLVSVSVGVVTTTGPVVAGQVSVMPEPVMVVACKLTFSAAVVMKFTSPVAVALLNILNKTAEPFVLAIVNWPQVIALPGLPVAVTWIKQVASQ